MKLEDKNGVVWGYEPHIDRMEGTYKLGTFDPNNYADFEEAIRNGAFYIDGQHYYLNNTTAYDIVDATQIAAKCLGGQVTPIFGRVSYAK